MIEDKILQVCKEECGKNVTKEDILTDTKKCNFCDIPYIILEQEKRRNDNMKEDEGITWHVSPLLDWDFIMPRYTEKQKQEMVDKIREMRQKRKEEGDVE